MKSEGIIYIYISIFKNQLSKTNLATQYALPLLLNVPLFIKHFHDI